MKILRVICSHFTGTAVWASAYGGIESQKRKIYNKYLLIMTLYSSDTKTWKRLVTVAKGPSLYKPFNTAVL